MCPQATLLSSDNVQTKMAVMFIGALLHCTSWLARRYFVWHVTVCHLALKSTERRGPHVHAAMWCSDFGFFPIPPSVDPKYAALGVIMVSFLLKSNRDREKCIELKAVSSRCPRAGRASTNTCPYMPCIPTASSFPGQKISNDSGCPKWVSHGTHHDIWLLSSREVCKSVSPHEGEPHVTCSWSLLCKSSWEVEAAVPALLH